MCNPSFNCSQKTEKAQHIDALTCRFDQSHRRSRKSSSPRCGQNRVEMAPLHPVSMKWSSRLTDQTNTSALTLYAACERQIIGGREVARIYDSDPVRIEHYVHSCPLLGTRPSARRLDGRGHLTREAQSDEEDVVHEIHPLMASRVPDRE